MDAKEKAKELVDKFDNAMEFSTPQRFAKQCALIAVDEIIKALRKSVGEVGMGTGYWSDVKQEIEKL